MPRNDIPLDDLDFIKDRIRRDMPIAARRVRTLLDRLVLTNRIVAAAQKWAAHDDMLAGLIREWEAE